MGEVAGMYIIIPPSETSMHRPGKLRWDRSWKNEMLVAKGYRLWALRSVDELFCITNNPQCKAISLFIIGAKRHFVTHKLAIFCGFYIY